MSFNNPEPYNQLASAILTQLYSSMSQPTVPTLKSQITEYNIPPFVHKTRIEMSNHFIVENVSIPKSHDYLIQETPRVKLKKLAVF